MWLCKLHYCPPPKYSMLLPNAKLKFLHTCNSKRLSFGGPDDQIGQCGSRLIDSGMGDRGLKVLLKEHKAKERTLAVFWYGLRSSCCNGPNCILDQGTGQPLLIDTLGNFRSRNSRTERRSVRLEGIPCY